MKEEGKKVIDKEFALMANTESKVFDNSLCSNEYKENTDSLNSKIKDLKSELSEANNYIYHYKIAVAQLEGRLTEYKEREVKYIEKIRTLEMYRESNLKCIKTLDKELEALKLEKDGLNGKLAGLLKASKNLDHLIKSQRSNQVKEGVGYNAVPSPAADLYLSLKKDLSWTGLPEFVDDTVTDYSRPSPTVASTSAEGQNKDSSTSEIVASPNPLKPFVKFVKPKDNQPKRKFPTASRKFTTGSTKNHIADMGRKGKAVKSSACWTWNPSQTLSNKGPINNSISVIFKKYTYIDTQGRLKHMTGNISYLSDFEPFDGGYVSFGQRGCRITGKGTINTGKLEFENVYFVRDLKYNLFSMSQIRDNKNSVLFTDTECIVLGRKFKLLDDANILLRTPRQHSMYSIDLNNIVPHKDLTCLVTKASADECILWHRRLG
nr:ribonuclease H-like domain-containing protein [Tanacetum cinerariifolium]